MRLNFNIRDRKPLEFFEDLSKKNFDKQFEIFPFQNGFSVDYKIREIGKYSKLNPLRLCFSPETDANKLQLAKNLSALINKYVKQIVTDKKCDVQIINKNLERISNRIIRHSAPSQAKNIKNAFEKGINTLTQFNNDYTKFPTSTLLRFNLLKINNLLFLLGFTIYIMFFSICQRRYGCVE